ncbi:tetratricopeptide repeat protein [Sorangium sp. So ce1078]|uniref:tetratricopeptide repeat protein n=1 Tax=Sorangium sp. So ce1078 TaxID=3133329 RepID=UPI003F62C42C
MSTDCQSGLLTRVRRGVATEPDRLAFDAHLASCESCRITWELAQDFDAVGAAEPGDAELLARIANAAIGAAAIDLRREGAPVWPASAAVGREGAPVWPASAAVGREGAPVWPASAAVRPDNDVRRGDDDARPAGGLAGRRGAGWRRSVWLYAAAAVLACGVAAAATALVRSRAGAAPGPSARLLEPSVRVALSRPRAVALPEAAPPAGEPALAGALPAPSSAPAPSAAALPELAAPAPRPRDAARGPSAAAPSSSASTAEQLFREANDARRAGSSRRAIELYRSLQKSFAASPEATLSLVSLGSLLLNTGSPAAALAQFDRYLGVAGARPLAVEALYGRGRALRALGRSADEAQSWRRLLREHPGSPYVEHARRRLAELGG